MAVGAEHESIEDQSSGRWPLDLRIYAGLCLLWSAVLMMRAIFVLSVGAPAIPIEDVIFGVKFYGNEARVTMALQAIIFALFALGILLRHRWGLILALLYMAQVIAGHVIFIASNLGIESQRVPVKIASIEAPLVLLVALYLWFRARPLLRQVSA